MRKKKGEIHLDREFCYILYMVIEKSVCLGRRLLINSASI